VRVILGIGNPEVKYRFNRHNVGFMVLDQFAETLSLSFIPSKYDFYYTEDHVNDYSFRLVKPTTYVNNTGIAALQVYNESKIGLEDFLVVVDDVNLETGKIRIREYGGDGGHNGMESIIYHLNNDRFPRMRVGIGNDFEKGEMASYVLSDFTSTEFDILKKTFGQTNILIKEFIEGGYKQMLNTYSRLYSEISNNNLLNKSNGE
jgi:peptidyl-tRNA hydrolase, PTH1 family